MVLIALLLVQTLGLAVQVHRPVDPAHPDGRQVRLLRLWTVAVLSPLERSATAVGHGVRGAWSDYLDLRHVRAENRALEHQLAELRLQRAELAEDALEGHRLQTLLGFQQQYVSSTVAARVIGTSGSDQSRLLLLNKGADAGLRPDMPVITPDGIVGKLRDVFPHTAQLLLINDPTSGAGVVLQSTRIRAIIKGTQQGRVVIGNLTEDSRIKPGETVLTSGGDQVFPRGLPVGTVQSIAPDLEHQPYSLITLKPAANLSQLEEVLIVTGFAPALDGANEQELTAEAAAHAAELSSQRLPGLHGAGPAGAGTAEAAKAEGAAGQEKPMTPPAENSREGAPRPKFASHPDRFSPGVTPPAADLVPGGTSTPVVPPVTPPPGGPPDAR